MANNISIFKAAVEGDLDEAVLMSLLRHAGADAFPVYGKRGKGYLRKKIDRYNNAARYGPWIILVDLNSEFECAPILCEDWLKEPAEKMCFRVAVRTIESWLLADRERIAAFLGISINKIPLNSEVLDDPKRMMVELARISRRKNIRADMVPSPRSGRKVGPAYTSCLMEYVSDPESGWRPAVAAERADSLKRCLRAIRHFQLAKN